MKIQYAKRTLTLIQQVELLKVRGLIINDEPRALHYLSHINYYRLSAYMYPLLKDKDNHLFVSGTEFQNVLDLYNFDRELRILLYDAIERIEVSVRTNITYILAHKYDPFWLCNEKLFARADYYQKHLNRLTDEIKRSDEYFLKHFFSKYNNKIPPAWITTEIISLGLLSLFYKNLRDRKDQKEISAEYKLHRKVFESWLHSILYVRNLCAHHCRIWNRELSIKPELPKREISPWLVTSENIRNDRIFIIIIIILYFLSSINPHHHFLSKLLNHLKKYPMIDLAPMGFPINWENEPILQLI